MKERWLQLWQRLKSEPPERSWAQLSDLYNSPDRHYHSLNHILACLKLLELTVNSQPKVIDSQLITAIELAIWFHDAIYDTYAADNEQQSANLARSTIQEAGLSKELADRVYQLVLATSHSTTIENDYDTQLLIDIDLAILGSKPDIFGIYESQIRQEYAWVPLATFRQKRAEILQTFLDRTNIYQTVCYREKFEAPARRNLAQSIVQLANK